MLTDSTADLAVALMLAVSRRLPEGERIVRAGRWGTWDPPSFLGRDLHGATVGDRRRGTDRAQPSRAGSRASTASCSRCGRERAATRCERALTRADFVTVHSPLTAIHAA